LHKNLRPTVQAAASNPIPLNVEVNVDAGLHPSANAGSSPAALRRQKDGGKNIKPNAKLPEPSKGGRQNEAPRPEVDGCAPQVHYASTAWNCSWSFCWWQWFG
jgi:hypothetical protein